MSSGDDKNIPASVGDQAIFIPRSILVEDNTVHIEGANCKVFWTTEGMFVVDDDSYKSQVELGTLLCRVLVVMESEDVQGHAMPPDYQNFILRQVLGDAITLPPYP